LADLATLQARLAEAEAAYHKLAIGGQAVQVRNAAGRFVQYAQAQMPALAAYIERLGLQIAALTSDGTGRRAFYVRLGN
jgi:hypothetical protein